jgi:hypothetical protein
MSMTEIVVQGTLNPDGTLQLDQKPNLPPGRVTLVLRPATETTQEGWWPYLQRVRAEPEAAGYPFMGEKEVRDYIEWLREGDRIDDLLREADQQLQQPAATAS